MTAIRAALLASNALRQCGTALIDGWLRESDELLWIDIQQPAQSLPQRELLNQISRGDAQFIQRQHLIYFRDLYDHMFRISETIDVERDMMAGTMEAYLSVVANPHQRDHEGDHHPLYESCCR